MRSLKLALVLAAVLIAVAAYAAKAPVNPDEPLVMTKGMYAELLCVAASGRGTTFTYEPETDTLRVAHEDSAPAGEPAKYAVGNAALRKAAAKKEADFKAHLLLPQIQRRVSPTATLAFTGF